uniref:Uncharacterized protein n=1 Tax=viral metagenome TaxID=1070528 RepID=A0A6M3XMQ6_9ZZZZ
MKKKGTKMNKKEHIKRHKELHRALDELFADFITHRQGGAENTTIELIEWSHKQTENPTEE